MRIKKSQNYKDVDIEIIIL